MQSEEPRRDVTASSVGPGDAGTDRPRMSRRQAMGRMSAVATAGAAAWVVPEILIAKPAAGATMSGNTNTNTGGSTPVITSAATTSGDVGTGGDGGTGGSNGPEAVTTAADTTPSKALAFTGVDIQRDAEVGAALVAGGWALRHWASRTPKPAVEGIAGAHQAGSAGDPT
jgi:hypothetical protein